MKAKQATCCSNPPCDNYDFGCPKCKSQCIYCSPEHCACHKAYILAHWHASPNEVEKWADRFTKGKILFDNFLYQLMFSHINLV